MTGKILFWCFVIELLGTVGAAVFVVIDTMKGNYVQAMLNAVILFFCVCILQSMYNDWRKETDTTRE